MSKKIEIKKIVIQIGDKEAELTIEQARDLKDALAELLGNKETVYVPSAPIIIERPYCPPWQWPNWNITWDATSTYAPDDKIVSGIVTYSLSQ